MEVPLSPAAGIISTTMPDGPGALFVYLRDSLLNHISGDWDGRAFHWQMLPVHQTGGLGPSQTQH